MINNARFLDRQLLIAFVALCTISSCGTDNNDIDQIQISNDVTYPLADKELWSYFQNFEEEALLRGFKYDLNTLEITAVIETITEEGVAGTCQYGQHIHHVTIDEDFWKYSSTLIREMVVFHELGHCVLHKDHTEEYDSNGNCLSIMNSGTVECNVAYTNQNRTYYIDELFTGLQ